MKIKVLNSATVKDMLMRADGDLVSPAGRMPYVRLAIYLVLVFALLLASLNYLQTDDLFASLIIATVLLLLLTPAYLFSASAHMLTYAEALILLCAMSSSLIFAFMGGMQANGVLWIFAFPFLAVSLKGAREGLQWSLVWLICMALCLRGAAEFSFAPVEQSTSILQTIAALVFYTALALVFSLYRSQPLPSKVINTDEAHQGKDQAYLEKLEAAAYLDEVTGLPRRLRLMEILQTEIVAAQERGHCLLVAHIRLNKMFETSNIIGAAASDKLIRNIASTMIAAVGSRGIFARVRRDEFICIYRQHTEDINETDIIKEIFAFKLEYKINEYAIHIGHTIGVASFPAHAMDAESLAGKAGQAMLQAQMSTQALAFYDDKLELQSLRRHQLFEQLHEALQKEGLSLHYQGLIDLKTGAVIGAEALARWIDPVSGPIAPAEFIPIAEKSGLIKPLTLWLAREAFGQLARWRNEGLDLFISINLSAKCVLDAQLVEDLRGLLHEFNLPAEYVTLELSEASFVDAPDSATQAIHSLHKLGFRQSIDDFGASYTSLAHLKNLKIDELKIDQSFLRNMAVDAGSRAIVQSAIQLAHNLNLKVLAEGIENARTEQLLQDMGCDLGQGYYFCKPMPANVFSQWARSWQINRRAVLSA